MSEPLSKEKRREQKISPPQIGAKAQEHVLYVCGLIIYFVPFRQFVSVLLLGQEISV